MGNINTFEENMMEGVVIKQKCISIIRNLKKRTNEWSIRDTLTVFTKWSFWSGSEMVSIDVEMADDIVTELYNYIYDIEAGDPIINDIYNVLIKINI